MVREEKKGVVERASFSPRIFTVVGCLVLLVALPVGGFHSGWSTLYGRGGRGLRSSTGSAVCGISAGYDGAPGYQSQGLIEEAFFRTEASKATNSGSLVSTIVGMFQGMLSGRALAEDDTRKGIVVRTAVRAKPTSEAEAQNRSPSKLTVHTGFSATRDGASGDYNQYRFTTLKNTEARALSIMTTDVVGLLLSEGWPVAEGDLGENILISGIPYGFFHVGKRFSVGSVIAEITESIAPCGNLCRLPWLERSLCPQFIRTLNGRRGWYAKVLVDGMVVPGNTVASASI